MIIYRTGSGCIMKPGKIRIMTSHLVKFAKTWTSGCDVIRKMNIYYNRAYMTIKRKAKILFFVLSICIRVKILLYWKQAYTRKVLEVPIVGFSLCHKLNKRTIFCGCDCFWWKNLLIYIKLTINTTYCT